MVAVKVLDYTQADPVVPVIEGIDEHVIYRSQIPQHPVQRQRN